MQLQVTESDDDQLVIEIAGEDHTFMNILKGALLETPGVIAATYDMNPKQSGGQTEPVLSMRTEPDTAPLDALEDGADRVSDQATAFREAFEAA